MATSTLSETRLRGGPVFMALGLVARASATIFRSEAQPGRAAAATRVVGTLVAQVGGARNGLQIELPDVQIFLEDRNRRRFGETITRLDGSFEMVAPGPGIYRICYATAAEQLCGPTVSAIGATVVAGRVPVRTAPSLRGRVLTADGRPCWMSDSFFGLDVSTRVEAAPASPAGPPQARTRANVQGEYALFGLRPNRYVLTAQCEEASATRLVTDTGMTADLTLPNHAPVLRTAAAFEGGRGRLRVRAGSTVDLRADAADPDGDTIQYMWRSPYAADQVTSPSGPSAGWRLSGRPGLRTVYLMARDGRGGFAYRRIDLEGAAQLSVTVSGRAVDEASGAPVRGAEVSFGSARGRTDANGWFLLDSEPRGDDRYVLNLRHANYALVSQILDRSVRGLTLEMTPVQVGTVSPDGAIRIADRTSGNLCGRPSGARERRFVRRAQRQLVGEPSDRATGDRQLARQLVGPRLLATQLLAQARATEPRCLERGAEVVIPAGALVYGPGQYQPGGRVSGPVRAAVATLNPTRRALPGDYRAQGRDGREAGLVSFGAIDLRFSDAQGRPLNLRPGAAAEVRIPVPPTLAAIARSRITLWSYDEEEGRWVAEGEARLERTARGAFFVGETRHFSILNMDIEFNIANATCVRVEVDPAFNAWTNKVLRAYVTFGGTSSQVKEVSLDASQYHGIFLLPYGPGNTLRLELRGTFNGVQQVLLDDFIVLAPPRPQMTGSDITPPYPYNECGNVHSMSPAPGVLPYYGDIDATGRPAFLTGPYGTFNPNPPQTAAYYAAIDPGNAKTTLGGWWQANSFSNTGQGTGNLPFAEAAYMNHNDLGFGRDMHCTEPAAGRLACYVTNYGLPDQNPQNADDAANQNLTTRGATVAMEFDLAAGITGVQFYVFGGGDAAAPRIEFADLDGLGPKPVPQLCMVCHGGNYNNGNNTVEYARFREFDLPTLRYAGGLSWDFGQPVPGSLDAAQFAQLNRMVRDAHPTRPIGALINAWYPNGFNGAVAPQLPTPPGGWTGSAQAVSTYHSVYGRSCRTCHLARDENQNNAFLVFNSSNSFGGVDYTVCGSGIPKRRLMPNAFVTYRNFWVDTPRVQLFEAFAGVAAGTCGN